MNKHLSIIIMAVATNLGLGTSFAFGARKATAIEVSASPVGAVTPLDLIKEAEIALQDKVKEVCGDGQARRLADLRIELVAGPANSGSSCAVVNPTGYLSGEARPGQNSGPAVGLYCYASFVAKGNVYCEK